MCCTVKIMRMSITIQGHAADIKHNCIHLSGLVERSNKTKHYVCMEDVQILVKFDHYINREYRETVEIEKLPNNLNRDDCWKINQNMIPTLSTK